IVNGVPPYDELAVWRGAYSGSEDAASSTCPARVVSAQVVIVGEEGGGKSSYGKAVAPVGVGIIGFKLQVTVGTAVGAGVADVGFALFDDNVSSVAAGHGERVTERLPGGPKVSQVVGADVLRVEAVQVGRAEQVVVPAGLAHPDRNALGDCKGIGVHVDVVV